MFYHALTGNGGTTPTEDLEPVLLWENNNPAAQFAAQTVSLDLTDYAGVLVEFERSIALRGVVSRAYIKKEDYNTAGFGAGNGGGYNSETTAAGRNVKINDNGVIFSSGYSRAEDNSAFIPVKIYGVKSYVVEPVVGDLLWHNNTPTNELPFTEIDGDYSKYSKIIVKGRYSTTNDFTLESVVFKNSSYYSGLLGIKIGAETSCRGVIITDTKITINTNFLYASSTPTQNNIYCIVTDIYGIE